MSTKVVIDDDLKKEKKEEEFRTFVSGDEIALSSKGKTHLSLTNVTLSFLSKHTHLHTQDRRFFY